MEELGPAAGHGGPVDEVEGLDDQVPGGGFGPVDEEPIALGAHGQAQQAPLAFGRTHLGPEVEHRGPARVNPAPVATRRRIVPARSATRRSAEPGTATMAVGESSETPRSVRATAGGGRAAEGLSDGPGGGWSSPQSTGARGDGRRRPVDGGLVAAAARRDECRDHSRRPHRCEPSRWPDPSPAGRRAGAWSCDGIPSATSA